MRAWWAVMLCAAAGWGQGPEMAGHVRLRTLPKVAAMVDALPRLVPNEAVTATSAAALNARFDRLDAGNRTMAAACHAAEKKLHGDPGSYASSMTVTMRGPRYLSLLVEFGGDCGGAHPDGGSQALVYDVITGAPIDWPALLPGATPGYKDRDGSGMTWVRWPVLLAAAKKLADADCRPAYDEPEVQFVLWLDGDAGTLKAQAMGLDHVSEATCTEPLTLRLPELRRLGVKPQLTDALQAASQEQTPEAVKRRASKKK